MSSSHSLVFLHSLMPRKVSVALTVRLPGLPLRDSLANVHTGLDHLLCTLVRRTPIPSSECARSPLCSFFIHRIYSREFSSHRTPVVPYLNVAVPVSRGNWYITIPLVRRQPALSPLVARDRTDLRRSQVLLALVRLSTSVSSSFCDAQSSLPYEPPIHTAHSDSRRVK